MGLVVVGAVGAGSAAGAVGALGAGAPADGGRDGGATLGGGGIATLASKANV